MDGIWLKPRIIPVAAPITVAAETRTNPSHITAPSVSRLMTSAISSEKPSLRKTGSWGFSLKYPLTSLFAGNHNQYDSVLVGRMEEKKEEIEDKGQNENWVLKILQLRSLWKGEGNEHTVEEVDYHVENETGHENEVSMDEEYDACRVDYDEEDKFEFDKNSFSKLLQNVSLAEARLYAKMSYLVNLSYIIPKIKPENLLKHHRLRFVTTSLEKKAEQAAKAEKAKASDRVQEGEEEEKDAKGKEARDEEEHKENVDKNDGSQISAVADDSNSTCSSPCEWFICDDDENRTRYFVIQGSESLQSWHANILFEPIQFEAQDVIVHRGIYDAAKGLYEEILPQVLDHLRCHGRRATIRLTGHSLGGSLSLLVNLMLLIRAQVPPSSLLPVITFGAPWVMCGGDRLLRRLGLPLSHLQGITLHRDIVPRAFSCNYPSRVAEILKAVNENFRNHPCLDNQNLLYPPMGELLILQPDANVSPSHHLLPSGSGMYVLRSEGEKQTRAAQSVFLNTPHPLEILSDRFAYGSEGAIQRDHDMETYITAIRSVICQELKRIRRIRREHRRQFWKLMGMDQSGREFLERLMVVLLPVRLLIVEACNVVRCR